MDLVAAAPSSGAAEQAEQMVELMCKVAFWCVQQPPEARPPMGAVVKMLEGEMEIAPPANPFQHLMAPPVVADQWARMTRSASSVPEISIEIA